MKNKVDANANSMKFNSIIFMMFSFLSLIYFTFGQKLFPSYFTSDSYTIRAAFSLKLDSSYQAAAKFYSLFGFNSGTPELYFQLFSWCVYLISLFTIFRINNKKIFSFQQLCVLIIFTIVYGAYYATLSKDLILVVFMILAINLFLSTRNYYVILLFMYLYSYYYRTYWEIICFIFFIILVLNVKKLHVSWVILLNILFIICYNIIIGSQVTSIRLGINYHRIANSMIVNLVVNNSVYTDIINYLYVVISMIIPIQGIGSINNVFYYLFVWYIFYLIYDNRKHINVRILYVVLIFFSFQATFEPDFGSALRHIMALFLIIYLFLYDRRKDIKS